jgi:glycosyltransferase involved in cell wall biosynthesis
MLRITLPRLDGYLSWNEDGAGLARRFGLPSERPAMVVPGIIPDPSLFPAGLPSQAEARAKFELPQEGMLVGFLGRLVEEKGLHDLLSAVERLDSSVYCAIWGEGALDHELHSYFARHPTRGRLLGAVPLSAVPAALQACDVVVVPSRTSPTWKEQFGRVAVEALLAGVPVVAYASGALPEVIGDAGLLVEEGDIAGLAHALATLTSEPERRLALSALGRAHALERFSPEVLADQVLGFWESARTIRASTHAG